MVEWFNFRGVTGSWFPTSFGNWAARRAGSSPVTPTKNNWFLDFYIELNNKKIDLEIDGKQHKYKDRIESDTKRDIYILNH